MTASRILLVSVVSILLIGVGLVVWVGSADSRQSVMEDALVHVVERASFESTITEPGDLESASNIEIRCRVRSRGTAGTSILEIIDEGTYVEKGDFLLQFDDSVLQDELIQQKIQMANDEAAVIQATSDLRTAEGALTEYQQGVYEQERSVIEADVAFAEETVRRAEEFYRHSKRLSTRGYLTDSQLEADKYAVVKARKELELAQQQLDVFEMFTRDRMIAELESEIAKQKANLKAAEFTLQLSKQRVSEFEEEIANCRIVAPADGMVVYANESDRRDSSIVIEEGVKIRDGQVVFRLPDPVQMRVVTHVNDSKINLVAAGDPALIYLDTEPERPLRGVVEEVAGFPLPRRWFQAPMEYEVLVQVTQIEDFVRPGLRAKVQIYVEQLEDVLQAPVSSLLRHGGRYFVIVRENTGFDAREVEIGADNDKFVVIENGLAEGEAIVIDGERYRDLIEFPAS